MSKTPLDPEDWERDDAYWDVLINEELIRFPKLAEVAPGLAASIEEKFPILDWIALWEDTTEEEWLLKPLLPMRRLVALYSPPKVGKSLLLLEIAAAIASGRPVLGCPAQIPQVVLYVDFENDPRGDIRTRLQAMGYVPEDLENLKYLSFPSLAYLDSERGGQELLANVEHHGAVAVTIDTVSRSVGGVENENDTWLNFYRHTGLRLKQAEVALIRLDHTGKDESKGQRGGSAKSGDVDAVWRLSRVGEGDTEFILECEAKRFQLDDTKLELTRETVPYLRHTVRRPVIERMAADGKPRPTILMGRVSAYLAEADGPVAKSRIIDAVAGNEHHLSRAIEVLALEGYATVEDQGPGRAKLVSHVSLFAGDAPALDADTVAALKAMEDPWA